MADQIELVKPIKAVDPQEIVEEALRLLENNQKNMIWKVKSGETLGKNDINALLGTIKSLAILKDMQLKSIELERKLQELEKDSFANLSDENVKKKILEIAEKIRKEQNEG